MLPVIVNIIPHCKVDSTDWIPLDFGIHSLLNKNINKNIWNLQITCDAGMKYQIMLSSGQSYFNKQRYLRSIKGEKILYNLYIDAIYQHIWDEIHGLTLISNGKKTSIPIYGLIPKQTTPSTGRYTDTIIITVSW
ncbi:MAG: spore coat U domain-containing protein [Candidatus Dasytiphilus stammeri]